jgi:hypothetical protein
MLMKPGFLWLLLFSLHFLAFPLFGQEGGESEETFSFAFDPEGVMATRSFQLGQDVCREWEVSQQVLDKLIEARGVMNMARPRLVLTNGEQQVAWCKPKTGEIGLEMKAYELCRSFGADSLNVLAALLSHELIHYYEKHDWTRHFAAEFDATSTGEKVGLLDERLKLEAQADYLGGFLAYTAGYDPFSLMEEFLGRVYEGYNFDDELSDYPPLGERQALARQSTLKLQRLAYLFDLGNFLTATGHYDWARTQYAYILQTYQSSEVHNNIGILTVQLALAFFLEEEAPFLYPIQLDLSSRMEHSKNNLRERKEKIAYLLAEAEKSFKAARSLNENYLPAWLNLACVYAMQGEYFDAEYHAGKALSLAGKGGNKKSVTDAHLLMALIKAGKGQREEAQAELERLAPSSELAQRNLSRMKGEHQQGAARPVKGSAGSGEEKVDGVRLVQVVNDLLADDFSYDDYIDFGNDIFFLYKVYEHSSLTAYWLDFGDAYAFFHHSAGDSAGVTTRGIQKGDSREKVMELYGDPSGEVQSSRGSLLYYPEPSLLFELDPENRVAGWTSYLIKRLGK